MISEEDFNQIYKTLSPKVQRLCLGYSSGDNDLASEWVQETFIKVWKYRKTFKAQSSIETWIYRIAINVCLSDLRKPKKVLPLDEHQPEAYPSDETSSEMEANIQNMYKCIDQLNSQNKAMIFMELEEIPQATIAETLSLAHGALRTRLSRIRKTLLKCMTHGK